MNRRAAPRANAVARRYLSLSLEIDPWSHPAQVRRARAVLDALAHGPGMLATRIR